MARAVFLSGSPRKGGNTDDCVAQVAGAMSAAGHDVEVVRLADRSIEPCRGCRTCMKLERCAIEGDDFEAIWSAVAGADLVVMAAPVYWFGPPGPAKDFIDRAHGYYAVSRPLAGRVAALLSVAADDGCWEPHERIMASWLECYGARMLPPLRVQAREKGEAMSSPAATEALDLWTKTLLSAL